MLGDKRCLYEIINPSDMYTFWSESDAVARFVVTMLGSGMYGLHRMDDNADLGTVIGFMKEDEEEAKLNEWFGPDRQKFPAENLQKVIDAFDSVLCMGKEDRELYEMAIQSLKSDQEKRRFRDEQHDKRRSSMNDIGSLAWEYADRYRRTLKK